MKRILFVAHVDINERNGAGLATLAFFNAIRECYSDNVDLIMPQEGAYGKYSNAIKVPPRSRLKAILSMSPHRYKRFIYEYLKKNKGEYDICVLNGDIYAGDMMDMIHSYGLKIIVIHHNFDREFYIDNKSLITLGGRTSLIVDYYSRQSYKKADVNCFLTEQDKKLFEDNYGLSVKPSFVIHVFEPELLELNNSLTNNEKKIVVCGSMNTTQTISGIIDLRDNYYPIIKDLCPDWDLVLAGRNPQLEVFDFSNQNPGRIQVIPNPPDMNEITNHASIFLCPTNVGGGLKLRVMDGLRQGLPILCHKISARGYDAFHDKPYFKIYEDRDSFHDGLSQLLLLYKNGMNKRQIQKDYFSFFGYEKGCKMMNAVIKTCKSLE